MNVLGLLERMAEGRGGARLEGKSLLFSKENIVIDPILSFLDVNRSGLRTFLKCLVVTAIIAESDTSLNGSGPNALSRRGGRGAERTWGYTCPGRRTRLSGRCCGAEQDGVGL